MRLVILDTNVLVSAAIHPDNAPALLVMNWVLEGQVQVVTSPLITAEYREVMRRPKFQRYGFPPAWIEFLIDESLQLPDPEVRLPMGPDVRDMPLLALAYATGAWLVTGNLKHFPEALRHGVKVLSPREYLRHLERFSVSK